jgi:aspartate aminotransferase-like enzyme
MTLELVNMSTGPVAISSQVLNALKEPAISHRSLTFKQLLHKTTDLLCTAFNVRETFILTGSGTLANETMLQQVKCLNEPGLILSNGEFGSRLIEQSRRNNLNFIEYKLDWGESFDLNEIEIIIKLHSIKWLLFCHCETSTGVVNNLDDITSLATLHNCMCFVDCMSTVGTMPMDLSKVSMATASSGKGFASIPGFAIIFSNIKIYSNNKIPTYLDLAHYSVNRGIPFTISSNLLKGLFVSLRQKLDDEHFELIKEYGNQFYKILNNYNVVPFSQPYTKVFTIAAPSKNCKQLIKEVKKQRVVISYESDYLKIRGLCQLASFGYYKERQLQHVVKLLRTIYPE